MRKWKLIFTVVRNAYQYNPEIRLLCINPNGTLVHTHIYKDALLNHRIFFLIRYNLNVKREVDK